MSDLKIDETGTAIVPVLSCVLNQLCLRNDRNQANNSQSNITKFHALRPPAISIRDYLQRIAKYAACSGECFVLCLVYIDRIIQSNPNFIVNSLNIHRLLITSIMLSAKFFDDQYYNNAYYAKVGGVPPIELNNLEVEFLFMCNFTLYVSSETYTQYYTELFNHANNIHNTNCQCSQGPKVPQLHIPQYSHLTQPPYDLTIPHSFYYVIPNQKELFSYSDIQIQFFSINNNEETDAHGQVTKVTSNTNSNTSSSNHSQPQQPHQSQQHPSMTINKPSLAGGLVMDYKNSGHQINAANVMGHQTNKKIVPPPLPSSTTQNTLSNINHSNNNAMSISPTPQNTTNNSNNNFRSGGLASQSGSVNLGVAGSTAALAAGGSNTVRARASAIGAGLALQNQYGINKLATIQQNNNNNANNTTADVHMQTGSPVIK